MNKKFTLSLADISKYRNELYGFSILWIILFHAISSLGLNFHFGIPWLLPLHMLIKAGNMGVDIFLFCSGVCLYFSYHKNPDAYPFLVRRIRRLFWPVLILSGGYWIWKYLIAETDIPAIISRLTLLDFWFSGDKQIWFISCILVGYIMYPYIYSFLFGKKSTNAPLRATLLIFCVCLTVLAIHKQYPQQFAQFEIALTRYPVFLVGCLFGKYVYDRKTLPGWIYLVIFAVDVMALYVLGYDIVNGIWKRWFYLISGIAVVFTFIFILNLFHCNLLRKFLAFFGKLSLNLYITHIIANRLYKASPIIEKYNLFHYFLMISGCVLVSWLVEYYSSRIGKSSA